MSRAAKGAAKAGARTSPSLSLETADDARRAVEALLDFDPVTDLGVSRLRLDRKYKVYDCPRCKGQLHAIGYKAFGVVCMCDVCGHRFRR